MFSVGIELNNEVLYYRFCKQNHSNSNHSACFYIEPTEVLLFAKAIKLIAPHFIALDLPLQNEFFDYSKTIALARFCVEINTRFRPPFRVVELHKYFKHTNCSVFFDLQSEESHDRGTFKVLEFNLVVASETLKYVEMCFRYYSSIKCLTLV